MPSRICPEHLGESAINCDGEDKGQSRIGKENQEFCLGNVLFDMMIRYSSGL